MKKLLLAVILILATTLSQEAIAMRYQPDSNAPRSSVPDKYKWDTSVIFKSDAAWDAAFSKVMNSLGSLQKYKGKLDSPEKLSKCLDEFFEAKLQMSRVSLYAELKIAEDKDVEKYQIMFQKTSDMATSFNTKTSFIKEAILRAGNEETEKNLAFDGIKKYAPYINELRRRADRVRSEETEQILAMSGDNLFASSWPTSDIEMIFKSVMRDLQFPKIKDEDGKEVQLNLSNYSKFRASKDRAVRKAAVEVFLESLKKYENILAAALSGEVKRDVFFAKARKYDRAVDAYLDADDIDAKVMDNLIDTVNKNLKPLHRYVELRKKMLGIKDIHLYDLYTPIVQKAEVNIPYDEGANMVVESLAPLGKEYADVVAKAVKPGSGWIDAYPNKGKESGAFSTSAWGIHPFIKLNYQDKIDDVSTLTHELGHTMHSYLNMNAQPFVTFGYSTFTAEIASTFNENLLTEYLLEKYADNDEMQLYILGNLLEQIRTTIYRQTLFAEFERKIHSFAEAGTPITADLFNKTYLDLVKRYYGPKFKIGKDDEVEWAFIPHFYYKFYVFSYATGLSSGIALSQKVRSEGEKARVKYIEMLEAPSTSQPIEILKKAGADLTKPQAIEAALNLMDATITRIEKILAKKNKR